MATPSSSLANDLVGRRANVDSKAYKGENLIRTDLPYRVGESYVHPNQVDFDDADNSWLAIGTYKSDGATDGNCDNDYDELWNIYTDGVINGQGFCELQQSDVFAAGDSPTFKIEYTICPSGQNGWSFMMQGLTYDCRNNSHGHADAVQSFLETVGATVERNVDVTFKDLRVKHNGVYQDFGIGTAFKPDGTTYVVSSVRNSTAFDSYNPPLD